MMQATITMDISEVKNMLKPIPQTQVNKMLYAGAAAIQESIHGTIDESGLVKTGAFKAGVRIGTPIGNKIDIHDSVKYGIYLEEGTRPHIIEVKNKKALHWKDGGTGDDRFSKKVHHPGTRAYKPFSRGLLASEEKVLRNMRAVLNER